MTTKLWDSANIGAQVTGISWVGESQPWNIRKWTSTAFILWGLVDSKSNLEIFKGFTMQIIYIYTYTYRCMCIYDATSQSWFDRSMYHFGLGTPLGLGTPHGQQKQAANLMGDRQFDGMFSHRTMSIYKSW